MYKDDKQAYDTHYNYINCLCDISNKLKLESVINFRKAKIPLIDTKKNLIRLTKKSLIDEHNIVKEDKDYSYASTSWLPVKTYYLIFNILLTTDYLFTLQKQSFTVSHKKIIGTFTQKLENQDIFFSEPVLNQVFDKSILNFKVKSGANLCRKTSKEDMYKMTLRKIAYYKVDDWKRQNNIENLRTATNKTKYQSFLKNFKVSIFDFPYYMRIRANYRDFAFIERVDTNDTANYFNSYFNFTVNFTKALEYLNKEIIKKRQ